MYRINYKINDKLPKLAWLARIESGSSVIDVYCGDNVECNDLFWVSGVWDAEFEKAGFDRSEVFYGSGAKISESGVTFVTPSHALDKLFVYRDDKAVTVSNSIPFLMAYNKLELDQSITQYERIMCSSINGYNKMTIDVPLKNGKHFSQYIVSLIFVDDDCNFSVFKRQKQKPFENFDEYYSRMMNAMRGVKENSISPARQKNKYGIVSTLSSGYDSSTCAAVAKTLGCDTVISLSGGIYNKDDGRIVAEQLGYKNFIRRDMHEYLTKKNCIDAQYLASGEAGTMLQFSVFEDDFKNNLVFFGFRGSYWSKTLDMDENFEMIGYYNSESDLSLSENALANNYISIPLPTFGASVCKSVGDISNSEEMKPWTLNTNYDKPIPRRILESFGVRRESFGQKKYGGGFSLSRDTKSRLANRMSKDGYESFIAFVNNNNGTKWSFGRVVEMIKYVKLNLPCYENYAFAKLHIKKVVKQPAETMANPGIVANLFFWGIYVMKQRYDECLKIQ